MRLFKHLKTKQIYGQRADGKLYTLTEKGDWSPTLHPPLNGLSELPMWEYPTIYERFRREVGE